MISVSENFANVISSLFVIRLRAVLVDGMKWQQKCAFYWLLTAMCVGVCVRKRDRDRKREIFSIALQGEIRNPVSFTYSS